MKNNIITIMKKECSRLFKDKRLLFMAVIMPGLLIYLTYTLMGNFMGNMLNTDKDYIYQIYVVNKAESFSVLTSEMPVKLIEISDAEIESVKQKISDKETDLLVKFPVDFDKSVEAYDVRTSAGPAPNIQIWSNMARTESSAADSMIKWVLSEYERGMSKKFDINAVSEATVDESYNMATEADMYASFIVYMLPMLLILYSFIGCQSIAPESIAGEKERGTLGTMLVTPAKRSDMAFAKILSVTIFGLLSALGSFIGLIASLPKIMQFDGDVSLNDFYSIKDYLLIFLITVSTVLIFVSLLSVLSAYAKSIKEATSYTMPLMLICLVCGMSSMLTGGAPGEVYYYLIPVFNSAQCLTAIFKFEASALNIAVTTGVNVLVALICVFVLTRMFNSEKIVFDK